jgi:short-subunit dehydrogenase
MVDNFRDTMQSFDNLVGVITGAASGIGRALATHLAQSGCHLALVDVQKDRLNELADQLRSSQRRISVHVVDVGSDDQMRSMPDAVLQQHGRVDILINNAGVSLAGHFEDYSLSDLEWIINTNLWGTIYGCRYFLPALRQQEAGHIVNIASDFGLIGLPTKTAYCTTKFAIRGLSESLRAELHGSGINVCCVYPGAVDTALIRSSRGSDLHKRDLEAEFVAQRGIPLDHVARRIINGIKHNQARILIGRDTYLIDIMSRLAPNLTQYLIGRFHHLIPFL